MVLCIINVAMCHFFCSLYTVNFNLLLPLALVYSQFIFQIAVFANILQWQCAKKSVYTIVMEVSKFAEKNRRNIKISEKNVEFRQKIFRKSFGLELATIQ